MKLSYRKTVHDDADLLIDIYNSSFHDDYVHYGECPGYGRTKKEMELSIKNFTKYIIMSDDTPVGVFSFDEKEGGQYHLGCLCVIPTYQGMGIGTQAFQYMCSVCPDWKQITLVTPADKEQNIKFYIEKCGFSVADKVMDGNVEIVNFCKNR